MTQRQKVHMALYGNVKIPRATCSSCQTTALVIGGELQCCGQQVGDIDREVKIRRMSIPEQERKKPTQAEQREMLDMQGHRCFYCERFFGQKVWFGTKPVKLRIEWDHMVPYSLTQNNDAKNFVAACHVCNRFKSSRCFRDVQEAQVYLQDKWERAMR